MASQRNGKAALAGWAAVVLTAVVVLGSAIAFAVNVNAKANTALVNGADREARLRAVEASLSTMDANLKEIRRLAEKNEARFNRKDAP